jgi:hypothetical protein
MNEDQKQEVRRMIERLVLLAEPMHENEARHIDEAIAQLEYYLD